MDDELAAMNASLDDAQNEFMDEEDLDEPHKKIELDSDPEKKSQEITDMDGNIDERDQEILDPENTSQINTNEPSAKSEDKQVKTEGGDDTEMGDNEDTTSQKSEIQDNEEGTDPTKELQDKAGDQLEEGDQSIFKNKKGLTKDDAVVDDTPETTDEGDKTRESVWRMMTSVGVGAFMIITLA
jgi:hypothetical protein